MKFLNFAPKRNSKIAITSLDEQLIEENDIESVSFPSITKSETINKSSSKKLADLLDTVEIPLFVLYFALHQLIMLLCGGLYQLNNDIGVMLLSICPAFSIMGFFLHFLLSRLEFSYPQVRSTFLSFRRYLLPIVIFCLGLMCIVPIFMINTQLADSIPNTKSVDFETSIHGRYLYPFLKFPFNHAINRDDSPFDYRLAFVGTFIAPFVEESFKFLLLALTLPFTWMWKFQLGSAQTQSVQPGNTKQIEYASKSLFIIFVALCGACGIALMENIGYLAACEWDVTKQYCLPNRKFDIMNAGIARGIFSVPFHCVTACLMADVISTWVSLYFEYFDSDKLLNRLVWIVWLLLSYPLSLIFPIFMHASFNYWMKGMSFVTALFTSFGFMLVAFRMHSKYQFIKKIKPHKQEVEEEEVAQNNVCTAEPEMP